MGYLGHPVKLVTTATILWCLLGGFYPKAVRLYCMEIFPKRVAARSQVNGLGWDITAHLWLCVSVGWHFKDWLAQDASSTYTPMPTYMTLFLGQAIELDEPCSSPRQTAKFSLNTISYYKPFSLSSILFLYILLFNIMYCFKPVWYIIHMICHADTPSTGLSEIHGALTPQDRDIGGVSGVDRSDYCLRLRLCLTLLFIRRGGPFGKKFGSIFATVNPFIRLSIILWHTETAQKISRHFIFFSRCCGQESAPQCTSSKNQQK